MSNIDTLIRCAMLQVMMLKVVVRTNMRMVPPVRTMSDVYMMFDWTYVYLYVCVGIQCDRVQVCW